MRDISSISRILIEQNAKRWIPLDYICPATTDRIAPCFERLRKECLDDKPADTKIAIFTEIRNNELLKKPDVIQLIAPMLPSKLK